MDSKIQATSLAVQMLITNVGGDGAIIGGVAVSLRAEPRVTADVDAIIWGESASARQIVDEAQKLGIRSRVENILEDARTILVLRLVEESTLTNVDVSLAYSGFEREAIDAASRIDVPGGSLSIPSVEDLVIMKAVAHRPRDVVDIALLAETYPDLDESRVRRWVSEFGEMLDEPGLWDRTKAILDHARNR